MKLSKSENYFKKRFVEQENKAHELSVANAKKLNKIYMEAREELEKDLAFFIERYSEANELTRADLKRMLNTQERAKFRYTIKGYIDEIERLGFDTEEAKALRKELDIMAGRTRVSRMQELISGINYQLGKSAVKCIKETRNHLHKVASLAYKDTHNILGNTFAKLDHKLIERIVNQKWKGANFSKRIWTNRKDLAQRTLKNIIIGISQGHEFKKMSKRLALDMNTGFYQARRVLETETTGALENAKEEVFKEMGITKYKFVATIDDRTSKICRELNGQIFEMKDRQIGVNCPFCHPFCRSVTVPVVDKEAKKKIDEKVKIDLNTQKESNIIEMEKEPIANTITMKWAQNENVEYIPAKKLEIKLSTDEIIKKVGGGDLTKGSCSSVALAYIGNKNGLDVLDFRDGISRKIFATRKSIIEIANLDGIKSKIVRHRNDFKALKELLMMVEENKEYYLATGRHASIIRKINGKYEYLELQSPNENGFKILTDKILQKRFGCQSSHTLDGMKVEYSNILIDVETCKNNQELNNLLGYLNTSRNNQKKGEEGNVK